MSKVYKKWTQSELEFINNNKEMLDKDLAVKLSEMTGHPVTTPMVRRQRRKFGFKKSRGRPRKVNSIVAPQSTFE
jgi:hypothetical protein